MKKHSAILLSGGLDSTSLAAIVKPPTAIFIDYGQTCAMAEGRAAQRVCDLLGMNLLRVEANCASIGVGALSGSLRENKYAPSPEWWPFRNQLLVTLAGAVALTHDIDELILGTVLGDRTHADGTPEFFVALNRLLHTQEGALSVAAPAINEPAASVVKRSGLGLDVLSWTHSCHTGDMACGECRGCAKRLQVLKQSGLY